MKNPVTKKKNSIQHKGGKGNNAASGAVKVAKKSPDNPFDKFANARKKHEVVNRRVKGEDRNVGRARKQALESRKTRLVQDFQSTKKTNSFTDRRFGEMDMDLSLEDKMFLRFQQERIKKARNSSLFNLDSGEQDAVLTHKGQVLGEHNVVDEDWHSDNDDDNGKLGKEVVNSLHFGGGFVPAKGAGAGNGDDGAVRKNRMDALQEIVMKSKLHKMQKKEAKEEQENEREKLDKDFQSLMSSSVLEFRPTKRDRGYDEDQAKGATGDWEDYDASLRAMAYEAKARPTDRTKSAEELALEARTKLEELEAARLRRMNATVDPDDAEAVEAAFSAGAGPRKKPFGVEMGDDDAGAKKRKRVTDDEVDGSFGSSYTASGTGKRRSDDKGAGDDDEEDDEDEDEEEGDEDDDEEGEEGEDGDEDEDDWEDDEEYGSNKLIPSGGNKGARGNSGADDEEEEEEEDIDDEDEDDDEEAHQIKGKAKESLEVQLSDRAAKRLKRADKRVLQLSSEGVNDQMPHKLACPSNLEEFDVLMRKYVRSVPDMQEMVDRILAWNSVHLPGAAGAENKGKMHNFLDVLLKVFARVGDSLADGRTNEADAMVQLDFLCASIYRLSQDLPDASPLLWGRTLKLMHGQLQKRLRDFVQGERESCWPSIGQLLLLRVLGHVFAVTDFQHALIGPASLFLGQCLAQCPVRKGADVARGLLVCSVLAGYTRETRRVVPEAFEFVRSVMAVYSPPSSSARPASAATAAAAHSAPQKTFDMGDSAKAESSLVGLRPSAARRSSSRSAGSSSSGSSSSSSSSSSTTADNGGDVAGPKIAWTAFDMDAVDPASAAALLATAQCLASDLALRHTDEVAFPELFAPLAAALRALRPQDSPVLPLALQRTHADLLESVVRRSAECAEQRAPLDWRKQAKVAIDAKNPQFQADYTFKKDRDPDETRAKLKQLTRQSKRETKAAMRELRRDGEFVDQLQFAEQSEKRDKLREERFKNYAWMEAEAANINLQVRKGGSLLRGGGSGVAKKARVKR